MARYDTEVLVVGAGVVGVAVARELCRFRTRVLVADRLNDVGGDASKSNSAIVHTGFDAEPRTLESETVVHANPLFDRLCRDLEIPFIRCGAILVATTEEEEEALPRIMQRAEQNQVFDVEYLTAQRARRLEPALTSARAGLLVPGESIVDPFLLVVAQVENAAQNGVEFLTSCEIERIERSAQTFVVFSTLGEIRARFVVNAAGLRGDVVSHMVGIEDFTVHPRRGQFHVIDRSAPLGIRHIILPVPTKLTKGTLLTPTVHGNWLIGPTAEEMEDRCAHETTADGMEEIVRGAGRLVPGFDPRHVITQYAGLRAVRTPGGYHLRSFARVPGFIELSGIRSTGITASPVVARRALAMLRAAGLETQPDEDFVATRTGIPAFRDLDDVERAALIERDQRYGRIVCRCETVTEAEIVQAVQRTPGARDMDGVKRRVRAGLGRCQGGFCGSRVPRILSELLGVPLERVTRNGLGSELLAGPTRAPGDSP